MALQSLNTVMCPNHGIIRALKSLVEYQCYFLLVKLYDCAQYVTTTKGSNVLLPVMLYLHKC